MDLEAYQRKRDFAKSPEPQGEVAASRSGRLYVIQKHAASRLHYDLRLEMDGVLKSWAVPKGPSLDPGQKRLAMQVEDHPIDYGDFEGVIPREEYGGGTVLVWDIGEWEPEGDSQKAYDAGHLKFRLNGLKLKGSWVLARMQGPAHAEKKEWLLIKHRDEHAIAGDEAGMLARRPESALTGRLIEQVAEDHDRVWQQGRAVPAGQGKRPQAGPQFNPADLPDARKAPMPQDLRPQLATAIDNPPEDDAWLHEMKHDGYRIICFIRDGQVILMSRNGKDWTDRFLEMVPEFAALPLNNAVLDGEMVVQRANGTSDFQALQNYFKGAHSAAKLVYFLFDLLYLEGYDLTAVPLVRRKQALKAILENVNSRIQYSSEIIGQGKTIYTRACELGAEGIVSKQLDSPYAQKRTAQWVKSKCRLQQEFVIGGYKISKNAAGGLRSLLVGYYESDKLIFAGKVGTGFSDRQRQELQQALEQKKRATAPFADAPRESQVRWAEPELVAEIVFAEWTREGLLRQPAFKGLREDKPAEQVVLESGGRLRDSRIESKVPNTRVGLTHPQKVLFPEMGMTKAAIAAYYQRIAERMLPFVAGRPLTLVRCPEGHTGGCFYQKHFNESLPEGLKSVLIREKEEERNYIYITDAIGLTSLVQISALELHPWGSRIDQPDAPDTLIFDLDPDPALAWEHVIQAAWHLRGILQGMGLKSFVKTSGGKGLHIQLPVKRTLTWDRFKAFAAKVAGDMAAAQPSRYTTNARKSARTGRIFVDYLRNARGATSVAPYSTRARPGAPLSMPIAWDMLANDLRPDAFTLENLPGHVDARQKDPWADYFRVQNVLPENS